MTALAHVTTHASIMDAPGSREAVLLALSDGLTFSSAANIVGLTRKALHDYRRKHPDFNAECMRRIAEHERSLVRVVTEAASEDAKHAEWLLERRHATKWSPRAEMRTVEPEDDERDDNDMSDEELEKAAT